MAKLGTCLGTLLTVGLLSASSFARVSYQLDIPIGLLDANYYSGAGVNGESATAGRNAFNASMSPDGSKVAFRGADGATGFVAIWVVDIGDPSSWRRISNFDMPLFGTVVWSPDGQFLGSNGFRIDAVTGDGANEPFYFLTQGDTPPVNDIENDLVVIFDFLNDGVSLPPGTTLETMDLDLDGIPDIRFARCLERIIDSDAAIATAFNNNVTQTIIDLGPAVVTGVTNVIAAFMTTGDANFIAFAVAILNSPVIVTVLGGNGFSGIGNYDLTAGAATALAMFDCVGTGGGLENNFDGTIDVPVEDGHVTALPSGQNIGVGIFRALAANADWLILTSINDDGTIPVFSAVSGVVVNLPFVDLGQARLSNDGTQVAFTVIQDSPDPATTSDITDIYLLPDVDLITATPLGMFGVYTGSVTSLTDPRLKKIRVSGAGAFRYNASPVFSADGSLLVSSSDVNDRFSTLDVLGSLPNADFDVVLSNTDDTLVDATIGGGQTLDDNDLRFQDPSTNALISDAGQGGLRIIFQASPTGGPSALALQIFISTFIKTTVITDIAEVQTTTEFEILSTVDENGFPIIIEADENMVQIDPLLVDDLVIPVDDSGTELALAPATVIDFPTGSGVDEISVSTPASPIDIADIAAQLPAEAAEVDALPILRDFQPDGTTFMPPIEVTITYTDSEIVGLDEANLVIFTRDGLTGVFEAVPESDIVNRDTVNNSITFKLAHFSTALVGGGVVLTPVSTLPVNLVLVFSFLVTGIAVLALRRRKANSFPFRKRH